MQNIKYNKEAMPLIKKGIDSLVNAVKVTLGPKGKNVIIYNNGTPHVTKDGVTVAKSIHLKNPYKNLGAELIKQAAAKTVSEVGDATTQTCILAQTIIEQGLKIIDEGQNPIEVKSGIDKAIMYATEYLKNESIPIKHKDDTALSNIAIISANNNIQIGTDIAHIYHKIGLEGIIRVEASDYKSTETIINKGMLVESGYLYPTFINVPEKNCVEFINPMIAILTKSNLEEVKDIIQKAHRDSKPLVIVSTAFENSFVNSLILNNSKGNIQTCLVKISGFGEERKESILKDIKVFTCKEFNTGHADKIIINEHSMLIFEGKGDPKAIVKTVNTLKEQIINSSYEMYKDDLKTRIANLTGGIATIYVGAPTEVEMLELKDRYDDATCAVKTAINGGISVGGGLSFKNAANYCIHKASTIELTPAELDGYNLICSSLDKPYEQLQLNADITDSIRIHQDSNMGFNVKTMQFENLLEEGIIDPTNSLISALQNAASVASMLLTTECAIILNE